MHVLIIDDSATVRHVMQEILRQSGMTVEAAADPVLALRKLGRERPDVIVLDLELPKMHGLEFLKLVRGEPNPIPVVICSSHVGSGTDLAIRALEEGAVDVIAKPALGIKDFLAESTAMIVQTVRDASAAGSKRGKKSRKKTPPPKEGLSQGRPVSVIAIAASTGGTEAGVRILSELPADLPGIVMVQHMPPGFTDAYARRLNTLSRLEVAEAKDGDVVRPGHVLVAPGGQHMEVVRRPGGSLAVSITDGPLVSSHRPSADVLFHSVARVVGQAAVGLILTGMGADGADGLLAMRTRGARTIAQDEASCVVFGMPKKAIERGAAVDVYSLDQMVSVLAQMAQVRVRAS